MNNFQNQNLNNQPNSQQQTNTQNQSTNFQQPNQQVNQQPSILTQIAGACLPVLLKQFTGQEMMPGSLGGNNMEMQLTLSQVLSLQQQILTTQQSLSERLSSLESNLVSLENKASNQFTNLVQEVKGIKSVRLTHQKETRAIDYNLQQESENNQY
jgi:hypothetical protein